MMLDAALVDEVMRLLAESDLSQRAIAAKTGVSRGSVGAIATGKRPDYSERPPPGSPEAVLKTFEGPAVRCKGCGRLVHLPKDSDRCMACVVGPRGPDPRPAIARPAEPPTIGLVGEHLDRYEALHRRKPSEPPAELD